MALPTLHRDFDREDCGIDPLASKSRPPRRRQWLFRALLVALPFLLLAVLELGARLLWPQVERDPYLGLRGRTSALTRTVVDGEEFFEFTHPNAYKVAGAGVTFTVRKPADVIRVIAFGGSANAGWPHPPPQRWTDYLATALQRAYPGKRFEVLNLGAHACASYRVRMIFDDAIEAAPDVIVIYSGNNEFVEKRSYALDFPGKRAVEWLKRRSVLVNVAAQWWAQPSQVLDGTGRQGANEHTWAHTQRIAAELRNDPAQYRAVQEHYRYSIAHMVNEGVRRGARVLVLTVPVNLRDWSPAVSVDRLTGQARADFEAAYRNGCAALLRGDAAVALGALDRAAELEPEHADVQFQRGRALEVLGRHDHAFVAYSAARDHDRNPFRASSELNAILADIVADQPQARLVDAAEAYRLAARHGLPGFDLLLDYVHPSRAGNELLARAVFDALVAWNLGGGPSAVPFAAPDDGYRDADDVGMQAQLLLLHGILHQYETFLGAADAYTALLQRVGQPLDPVIGAVVENTRAAFRGYLGERRKELLGEPFAANYRERHAAFFREFFVFASELKGELRNPDWHKRAGY
jgi:tetratricopeptide (TPR) repeat protein